jgi:ABC-2 type transport system permease protein
MIFTNSFSNNEAIEAIILQGVWVIILVIPIQILWVIAKKQLIIQGG